MLVNPPTLLTTAAYLGPAWQESSTAIARPYYDVLRSEDRAQIERAGVSTFTAEHLGLQSLQATLLGAGHTVSVLNACVELHSSLPETLRRIEEHEFDFIGFSGPLEVFSENRWLARALRDRGFTGHITIGHDFPTLNHDTLLRLCPEFDSVVRGEGERTLLELVKAVGNDEKLEGVLGISFRDGDQITTNAPRPAISDLDDLPPVTRFDLPAVLKLRMSPAVFSKRGCLYQCTFCTTGRVPTALGFKGSQRWRQRSPNAVVDEIERLVKDFGVRQLTIVDDLYVARGPGGAEHALQVADLLLSRGLTVEYMVDCRVDSVDRDVFTRLRQSGLRKVYIGVESGSETVLREYKKGYNQANFVKDKLAILEDIGISVVMGFIFFNPADDLEGLASSHELVCALNYRDPFTFMKAVRVYPGTTLHRDLEQRALISGEWPDYTARYADPWVDALRVRMSDFFGLASQLLEGEAATPDWGETELRDATYDLVARRLGEMIQDCRRQDSERLESTYRLMVAEFTDLMSRHVVN